MGAPAPRVVVVMPAYNAAKTLEQTYRDIPRDAVHRIILVDDVSRDETVEIARRLGVKVVVHMQNMGYGGNQKTCYLEALRDGADIVVMLHPDYQYDSRLIPRMIAPIAEGRCDMVLGLRMLDGGARAGGDAGLQDRLQPGAHRLPEPRLPSEVHRPPHRLQGVSPGAPRDRSVPPQLRRLRLRL